MNVEILRQKNRLDALFSKNSFFKDEPEIQSHWARYLCILTSGFLENSVRELYSEYAKSKCAPYVANFVERQISRFQNPDMNKILTLVGSFSQEWEEDLRAKTSGEICDAVNSIVNNRNNIAHGRNVGISYVNVKDYYERILELVDIIEEQCKR
jgi:RiboL-PSP-HEPN